MSVYELVMLNNSEQPVLITDQDLFGGGTFEQRFNPTINVNGPPNYAKAVCSGIIRGSFKVHIDRELFDCSFSYDAASEESSEGPKFDVTASSEGNAHQLVVQSPLTYNGIPIIMIAVIPTPSPTGTSTYSFTVANKLSQAITITNRDSETKWEESFSTTIEKDGAPSVAKAVAEGKPVEGYFQVAVGQEAIFNCQFSYQSGKSSPTFKVPSNPIKKYILSYDKPVEDNGVASIHATLKLLTTYAITVVNKTSQEIQISDVNEALWASGGSISSPIASHQSEKGVASADGQLSGSFVISVSEAKFTCTFGYDVSDPKAKPSFKVSPKSAGKVSVSHEKPSCANDVASVTVNVSSK